MPGPRTVGAEPPGRCALIHRRGDEPAQLSLLCRIGDADKELDPPVQIPVHEIGAADPDIAGRVPRPGAERVNPRSPPFVKAKTRECSRNRPTMLRTRIVSDMPGTPGRTAQIPRTNKSMGTPACDARYSESMVGSSMIALHFIWMREGSPSRLRRACSSICSTRPARTRSGATSSRR